MIPPRDVPAHYIKGNSGARVPDRLICLDTEADRVELPNGEDQTWSLGVASYTHWTTAGARKQSWSRYDDPLTLWRDITAFTRAKRRTVLYTHNVGYDVRIGNALVILPELGWQLKDARIDDRSAWFRFRLGTRTLLLCDSVSIFNVPLDRVGQAVGIVKQPLPPCDDRERLFLRCENDVDILTTAMVEYFEWLRTGEAGNWQVSGASQSWAHWRHSHYTHKILVHDNTEALAAERKAMYTGRCEAWRWGEEFSERVYEYDYSNAYPRIARDTEIPTRLKGTTGHVGPDYIREMSRRYRVLAEGTITTRLPVVPVHGIDGILWPVGTFTGLLWDCEYSLAIRNNAHIDVQRTWLYERKPALGQWGRSILTDLYDDTGRVPEWRKLVLKNWSRTLIGRFGMRYRSWEKIGDTPDNRLWLSTMINHETGQVNKLMHLGRELLEQTGDRDGPDACPQITSYIMAQARVRLWEATLIAGQENVYYMDTDSLLVNAAGRERLDAAKDNPILDGLRLKQSSHGWKIYGPRAIILDGSRKVAGLPRKATPVGEHEWAGETWESCGKAIAQGRSDLVTLRTRSFSLVPNQKRRQLLADGTTSPYTIETNRQSPTCIESQTSDYGRQANATLSQLGLLAGVEIKQPSEMPGSRLRYSVRAG